MPGRPRAVPGLPRLAAEHIPFDLATDGLAILVVDTGSPHQLVDGDYADRRSSCEAAAASWAYRPCATSASTRCPPPWTGWATT